MASIVSTRRRSSTGHLYQFAVSAAYGWWRGQRSDLAPLCTSPVRCRTSARMFRTTGADVRPGTASTAYGHNLAYHRDAFAVRVVDLVMPEASIKAREVMDGISMRCFVSIESEPMTSLLTLTSPMAACAARPEMACRDRLTTGELTRSDPLRPDSRACACLRMSALWTPVGNDNVCDVPSEYACRGRNARRGCVIRPRCLACGWAMVQFSLTYVGARQS